MVLKNSCNIMVSSIHIFYQTSQKLFVLHWPVVIIQLNPIDLSLICAWNHLLGKTSESSLILLDTRCLQSYTYFSGPLLQKPSTSTCQDFHQIVYLPYTHPRIGSLDLFTLGLPLDRSDY